MTRALYIATAFLLFVGCRTQQQPTSAENTNSDPPLSDTIELNHNYVPRFSGGNTLRAKSEKAPTAQHEAILRNIPFEPKEMLFDHGPYTNPIDDNQVIMQSEMPDDTINYIDPHTLYERALKNYYSQNYFDAVQDLNKAIYEKPDFSEAYFRRGEARAMLGDHAGAMKDFETAANQDNLAIDIRKVSHVQCGIMREKLKKYGEAIVHYDLAIQMDSNYVDAYKRRAWAKDLIKDFDGAYKDYSKVLALDSGNIKTRYRRAKSLHESGKLKQAVADYTKVIESRPNYSPAYFYRGMANYQRKHYREALTDYNRVTQLDPADEEAHFDRGLILFQLQDYKDALYEFETALHLDPEDTDARINKALCLFHDGNSDAAIREFNEVLRQDSNNVDALVNLGIIELEKEQYKRARDHFDHILHLEPENPEAFYYRGIANYELKDKRSACLDFEMAYSMKYAGAMHMIRMYCNDKNGN